MTFEEYQKEAVSYRTETANNEEYLTLGLIEEVGEAAGRYGYTLEQVAEINLAKLRDRAARGQIHGNGDER